MILCVPGPWRDRSDFVRQVTTIEANGRYFYDGSMLVDVREQDQLRVQLLRHHPRMVDAFRAAGRGDISAELEKKIAQHQSSIYLRFPANFVEERTRVLKYTGLARQLGGIAIKIESSGVGHAWERWFRLLGSQNEFDWYCAVVMLLADERIYYSCGMHHFGLADAAIGNHLAARDAGNLLNKFNYWRIIEPRELKSGDTFRLDDSNRRYRVDLGRDQINPAEDLFHNPHGLWFLTSLNAEAT
jgi:hypothetical protein